MDSTFLYAKGCHKILSCPWIKTPSFKGSDKLIITLSLEKPIFRYLVMKSSKVTCLPASNAIPISISSCQNSIGNHLGIHTYTTILRTVLSRRTKLATQGSITKS